MISISSNDEQYNHYTVYLIPAQSIPQFLIIQRFTRYRYLYYLMANLAVVFSFAIPGYQA